MNVRRIIRILLFSKRPYGFIMLAFILITYGILGKNNSVIKQQESAHGRGVITTLIRSNNQSIFLTINMLHSVLKFHSYDTNHSHPFIIFHDQNFTMSMREQILSCVLKTHKHAQISFALVDFQTSIQPSDKSRLDKTIGYRLMCRFWSYDVFYHPVILQNQYDYLMRMDDDSYFSDQINEDLFVYMYKQKLDYMYRATYQEKTPPMEPIEKRYLTQGKIDQRCIYNNFFIIRLKWLYKSKQVQNFLHELIVDNLMLREYIGDGCVHATMLKIDDQVKSTRMTDIPYGHNYHVMPSTRFNWMFRATNSFYTEIQNSCDNLIVLRGAEDSRRRLLIAILLIIYLIIWFISLPFRSSSISSTSIDTFLNSTICGRLIRYPDVKLTNKELIRLRNESSAFFSISNGCNLFEEQKHVSSEELTYPLAFTILVHENLEQLDFLLRTIYRSYNYYCIHVDLKSSLSLYQGIVDRSKCVTNIFLPEKRLNVSWGRFSVLEAEHSCQKVLLQKSKQWKYYFNLAGSDIPLKTNYEMVKILKLYNHQNDITSLPFYFKHRHKNSRLPSSISLPLYKGEFHVLLTRQAVEFVHNNSRVADLYNFLNGTDVPDEHFYSIINRWKETPGFYPHDHDLSPISFMTRYKIWSDRPESRLCHGGYVRTICVFNYQDLWHLATSPHFFGNKIPFGQDRIVPYCMTKYLDIRNRMKEERNEFLMIDEEFYKNLKNVRYGRKKLSQ